jgi:hypothetical protein
MGGNISAIGFAKLRPASFFSLRYIAKNTLKRGKNQLLSYTDIKHLVGNSTR